MLIITAQNVTNASGQREDGAADYAVWIGVNHRQIWAGRVDGHVRAEGAGALLRRIADGMAANDGDAPGPSPVDEAIMRVLAAPVCPKCGSQKLRCDDGCTWRIK